MSELPITAKDITCTKNDFLEAETIPDFPSNINVLNILQYLGRIRIVGIIYQIKILEESIQNHTWLKEAIQSLKASESINTREIGEKIEEIMSTPSENIQDQETKNLSSYEDWYEYFLKSNDVFKEYFETSNIHLREGLTVIYNKENAENTNNFYCWFVDHSSAFLLRNSYNTPEKTKYIQAFQKHYPKECAQLKALGTRDNLEYQGPSSASLMMAPYLANIIPKFIESVKTELGVKLTRSDLVR